MNKSKIRSKIINLRKKNFNKNFQINLDKFFSFLKTKTNLKNLGGYYSSNYEIDDLEILDFLEKKNELIKLSNKFKELKSLIYDYKDKKDVEIKELNINHQNFKNEIEVNHKKYEQLIDEAADEISNFVEKAKLENISQ